MKNKKLIIATMLAVGATTVASDAAFTLIEDFTGLTAGNSISTGTSWVRHTDNNSTVAEDPTDSANLVGSLSSSSGQRTAYLPLGANAIADTSTGTIFFRLRTALVNPNMNLGASDVTSPANAASQYSEFESQLRFATSLDTRDNSGFQGIGTVTADQWTNFWLVIDNVNNNSRFYSSVGTAAAAELGAASPYSFRNGTASNAITTFLTIAESGTGRDFFIDDIYVDNASANLANPIPEPSVTLLGAIGLLGLLRRRR